MFNLINEGTIHIEPDADIIPQESLGQLLSAEEVQNKVLDDAETYRTQVVKEVEELKQQAVKEGYEEGYKSWLEHIAKLEEEIVQVRKAYEKILVPVALKAVQKIFGKTLETKEDAIVDIVSTSLKAVSTHKKITIYVSPKEKAILEAHKPKLKSLFEVLETFIVRERADLKPGDFVIETEGGIINGQADNQWRILERAFEQIFKRPNE